MTQIPQSLDGLSNSITGLQEGLSELIRRLSPALRPREPREGNSLLKAVESRAELAETIGSLAHNVNTMHSDVMDALDRLEL